MVVVVRNYFQRLRARRACDADGGADDAGGVVGRATTLGVVKVVAGLVLRWRNGIIVLAAAAEAC